MGKDQNGSFGWLLRQSGERKGKFAASVILAAISMLCGIVPYYFIARTVSTTRPTIIVCTKKYCLLTVAATELTVKTLSSFWSMATHATRLKRCLWTLTCSMKLFVM
ncbi:hypothetical protein SAMN02910353_02587 [Ruminococcus sp. YRD2003]|uniref:hypothetical protein n=1 Tax=Ruminococcus sp. YRD2003 TaxID=1452313 RepID=UPI0008B68E90|nr:hypothetical protein SAMN02910353_02587 [Ruminococcus flavefaciens]